MTMLSLDSPSWATLEQAYGTAEDIPHLLAHLATDAESELGALWMGLWATLWRGGRIYSASYAALPHLVAYASRQPAAERARALHLVASIELARVGGVGPPLPDELAPAYHAAIASIPAVVAASVGEPWSDDTTQILSAVLAIAKGNVALGRAALDWGEEPPSGAS